MTVRVEAVPVPFQRRVQKALKYWHDSSPNEGLLDDLLIAQRAARDRPLTQRLSTNLVLAQGLEQLAMLSPDDAHLLDLRFSSLTQVRETCERMNYAESTIYNKQNQAISLLAAILYRLESTARQERLACLDGNLDPPPAALVGVEPQIERLSTILMDQGAPWLISIEGIGGIGKTALAAAVLRRMAENTCYSSFAWVSAQVASLDLCGDVRPRPQPAITGASILAKLARQVLPDVHPALEESGEAVSALRRCLHKSAHLIVIDNWETVLDAQALLPLLHSLSQPSRFILTSRRRLLAEPNVYLHCVPELSEADSLLLIRRIAQAQHLAALLACDDREMLPLYAATGGNPLAIMLVLEQLHVRPLRAVLADLAHVRTAPMEMLFDFTLHQAWRGLREQDRRVLKAIPAAELCCLDAEAIAALCRLTLPETLIALQHLVRAGLIQTTGDLNGCQYRLHNLARTYLRRLASRRN